MFIDLGRNGRRVTTRTSSAAGSRAIHFSVRAKTARMDSMNSG
jgi:hypothetical protein